MVDALATLAATFKVGAEYEMMPIDMQLYEYLAHCYQIEEVKDTKPWYYDILQYIKHRSYPEEATETDKRTIRRMSTGYVLDGEVLYKKSHNQVLLRCVDTEEAKMIMEEVHDGVCGAHANGHMMSRQIMRCRYFWSTLESVCINYAIKCHKCQIYGDKINVPPHPLHVMTSPWPFSKWGMDAIRIITDNATNLNNKMMKAACEQFNIKPHNSTIYIPKMNGAVEAVNKNIKKIVEKTTETYKDWHEKLFFALFAYRTLVQTSTEATPFSLAYGMEAMLPIEVEISSLRVLTEVKLDNAEWVQSRYDQLNLIDEKRLKAIHYGQIYNKRMIRAHDKKVRPRIFREGDLVLRRILPVQKDFRGKWTPNWEEPYVVKKAFSGLKWTDPNYRIPSIRMQSRNTSLRMKTRKGVLKIQTVETPRHMNFPQTQRVGERLHSPECCRILEDPLAKAVFKGIVSTRNVQYLDFNFMAKDIQVNAQLHNEEAIHDFNSTTEDIVPTHPRFQLHDGGYHANFNFTAKDTGLETTQVQLHNEGTIDCQQTNFIVNFNFTMKDIRLKTTQAQLHGEGAADCQQRISQIFNYQAQHSRQHKFNFTTNGRLVVNKQLPNFRVNFNFTAKDIRLETAQAQLHSEGATDCQQTISQFQSQFQLHDGGYWTLSNTTYLDFNFTTNDIQLPGSTSRRRELCTQAAT
ncbi:RING-H2 finger protein ATL43-like [Hibiscus syriacus]|uniref:RING-H2 finger protein ATL43-like n=1 Tax=Hibiscus syriacus TaxID=106335 RepID=A0A6A2Z759_HIBSY|nr:RING-H2 finger protein ATL43-like [Hibiscus syriacus]